MSSDQIMPREVQVKLNKRLRLSIRHRGYLKKQLTMSLYDETKKKLGRVKRNLLSYKRALVNTNKSLLTLKNSLSYLECCIRSVNRWLKPPETYLPSNQEQLWRTIKRAKRMLQNMSDPHVPIPDDLRELQKLLSEMNVNMQQGRREIKEETHTTTLKYNDIVIRRRRLLQEEKKIRSKLALLSADAAKIKNRKQYPIKRSSVVEQRLARCRQMVKNMTKKLRGETVTENNEKAD